MFWRTFHSEMFRSYMLKRLALLKGFFLLVHTPAVTGEGTEVFVFPCELVLFVLLYLDIHLYRVLKWLQIQRELRSKVVTIPFDLNEKLHYFLPTFNIVKKMYISSCWSLVWLMNLIISHWIIHVSVHTLLHALHSVCDVMFDKR